MTDAKELLSFIDKLFKELEIEEPLQDQSQESYTFSLGKGLDITLKNKSSFMELSAALGICPQTRHEELFSLLMHANLFGKGTGHAAIGLDPTSNALVLKKKITQNTNYADFKWNIEDFVNYVDLWQKKVRDLSAHP